MTARAPHAVGNDGRERLDALDAAPVPAGDAGDGLSGEAAEPAFRLRNVRYSYPGGQVALDGVSLDIRAGERVALLGANGSGKSTLLKLLDGIIAPAAGEMRALGREVAAVAAGQGAFAFHREVGLVFQDPDIQLFSATVLDDVAFGPLQMGLAPDEVRRRCDEALGAMAIEHIAGRAPFELSGGEKKRAAIASVLSLRPTVLLLDEPTASLDPRTKWVLVDLIQRLEAAGRTLVVATHELDIVPLIADRAVVLSESGHVIADGPCAVVLADTGLLVRANLIHAHLHRHGQVSHSHPHEATDAGHAHTGELPGERDGAVAEGIQSGAGPSVWEDRPDQARR
jgi:cobalt/nickel transport system ATP-binding protein